MTDSDITFQKGLEIANQLREEFPLLCILQHTGGGNLKNQFKKADKSGARFGIIIGEHEYAAQTVAIKFLREDVPQQSIVWHELPAFLNRHLEKHLVD
jgi:histidyl-tRNA synthetase